MIRPSLCLTFVACLLSQVRSFSPKHTQSSTVPSDNEVQGLSVSSAVLESMQLQNSDSSGCPFTSLSSGLISLKHDEGSRKPHSERNRFSRFKSKIIKPLSSVATRLRKVQGSKLSLAKPLSLPVVGSMKRIDRTQYLKYFPSLTAKYGDFYKIGIPALARGLHGYTYVTTDPNDMERVFRQEGSLPSGALEALWPAAPVFGPSSSALVQGKNLGPFGRGKNWLSMMQFYRNILQASRGDSFISNLVHVTERSSKNGWLWNGNLSEFFSFLQMDNYIMLLYGAELNATATLDNRGNDIKELCVTSSNAVNLLLEDVLQIKPRLLYNCFRARSPEIKKAAALFQKVVDLTSKTHQAFKEKHRNGELTKFERDSSMMRMLKMLDKGKEGEQELTEAQMESMFTFTVTAAIDTTSAFLAWVMTHLALNPSVQEKLREETQKNVRRNGGRIGESTIVEAASPYLHAILRETHRITPIFGFPMLKEIHRSDIMMKGHRVPNGSAVLLDVLSIGHDPSLVENPKKFWPERWDDEAVQKRKGTPSEVIDARLCAAKYGAGKRSCPGAHAADLMLKIMVSQLVLDWGFTSEVNSLDDVKYKQGVAVMPDTSYLKIHPLH